MVISQEANGETGVTSMLIGVLSDTHLREGRPLPSFVWLAFADVDLILHAGDVVSRSVLVDLGCLAPVKAVRGNCDGWELADLPAQAVVTCEDVKIGLVHGFAGTGRSTPERAFNTFAQEDADIIVFGHSHSPVSELRHGILLFNPGSPTDKRREARYSLGLLRVEGKKITPQHLYF